MEPPLKQINYSPYTFLYFHTIKFVISYILNTRIAQNQSHLFLIERSIVSSTCGGPLSIYRFIILPRPIAWLGQLVRGFQGCESRKIFEALSNPGLERVCLRGPRYRRSRHVGYFFRGSQCAFEPSEEHGTRDARREKSCSAFRKSAIRRWYHCFLDGRTHLAKKTRGAHERSNDCETFDWTSNRSDR